MSSHTEARPSSPSPTAASPSPLAREATVKKTSPGFMRWLVPLAILAVVGSGIGLWWRGENKKGGEAHASAPAPGGEHGAAHEGGKESESSEGGSRVEAVHPKTGSILRTATQNCTVHALEEAELYSKVSGYLKVLNVDIGDRVKEGQLLAIVEDPELNKEADRAAAFLEQAKAMVVQAEARQRTAEADLKSSEALVKKSEADVEQFRSMRKFREIEFARYEGLYRRRAIPAQLVDEEQEHLDAAKAAEHSAEAEVMTSEANVVAAKAKIDQALADLAEARSNVEVATASLGKAQVMVEYTKIISPYTGVISYRGFHRGAFIRSAEEGGEKPILKVMRTDMLRVVTYVPDLYVPFVNVGDRAIITLDALPNQPIEGKVTRFSESEEPESRTMRTEVNLPNPNNKLREGMFGLASIVVEESSGNLLIPVSSVPLSARTGRGKAYVMVIRDGKVQRVAVRIGVENETEIEVLEGLTPEDYVAVAPSLVTEGKVAVPAEPTKTKK